MKLLVFAALLSIVKCSLTNLTCARHCSKKEEWMDQCEEFRSNIVAISHEMTNVQCELRCGTYQGRYFPGECAVLRTCEKDKCFIPWDPPPRSWIYAIEIVYGLKHGLKTMGDDDVDDVINALELEEYFAGEYFPGNFRFPWVPPRVRKDLFKPSKGIRACQAWSQLKKDGKFVIGGDFDFDLTVHFKDGKCSFFPWAMPSNEVANLGATPNITNNIATSRFCGIDCTPRARDCFKKEEWMDQCLQFKPYVVALARHRGKTNIDCDIACEHSPGSRLRLNSLDDCAVMTKKELDRCFVSWDPPQEFLQHAYQIIPGLRSLGDDDVGAVFDALKPRDYFSYLDIFRTFFFRPSRGILVCQAWLQLRYTNGKFVLGDNKFLLAVAKDGKCYFFEGRVIREQKAWSPRREEDYRNARSIVSMRFCPGDCPNTLPAA